MLYLYLDESGDLGFDFVTKKPSDHFAICVLAIKGQDNDRALAKVVRAVLHRKLPRSTSGKKPELKGSELPIDVKKYFYRKLGALDFRLHTAVLNKRRLYGNLALEKERIYSYLARLALESVNFKDAAIRVIMTVDKHCGQREAAEFNRRVLVQLKALIDPLVPLEIFHVPSHQSQGLQAADLFCWGVFRKYEMQDREWYDVFKGRVASEKVFLQ